jgi:hypothetical protein
MRTNASLKRSLFSLLSLSPLLLFSQDVKFNNNYTVACHNCYEKKLASDLQDVFTYTKTIEIDIWNENFGLGPIASLLGKSLKNDWYVKHKPQQRGNKNCVGGSFRDCLLEIKAWSDANPDHDVITIFVDKKQNWWNGLVGKSPADLDDLLLSVFTKQNIFTPADLLQNKANLKEAALSNWPSLQTLKGKFVFVLTDGTILNRRKPLREYLLSQKKEAVCFVSPRIESEKEIFQPKGFSKEAAQNVVFYNLKEEHGALAEKINSLECITRVYGSSKKESFDYYEQLVNQKVNFVAFYNYKVPKEQEKEQTPAAQRKAGL